MSVRKEVDEASERAKTDPELPGEELYNSLFEPRHEKTCLRGFQQGKTQTGLRSHRS